MPCYKLKWAGPPGFSKPQKWKGAGIRKGKFAGRTFYGILKCGMVRPNALDNLRQLIFREIVLVIPQKNGNCHIRLTNVWRDLSNAVFNPIAGRVNRIKTQLDPFRHGFGGNNFVLLLINVRWCVGHLNKFESV